MSVSEILDPNRNPKTPRRLKAERTFHRVTMKPSSASPGETLYVAVPRLSDGVLLAPGSLALRFDLSIAKPKHAINCFVNNLGRNLVTRRNVTFAGEIIPASGVRGPVLAAGERRGQRHVRRQEQCHQRGLRDELRHTARPRAPGRPRRSLPAGPVQGHNIRDHPGNGQRGCVWPRRCQAQLQPPEPGTGIREYTERRASAKRRRGLPQWQGVLLRSCDTAQDVLDHQGQGQHHQPEHELAAQVHGWSLAPVRRALHSRCPKSGEIRLFGHHEHAGNGRRDA